MKYLPVLAILIVFFVLYFGFYRPWQVRWGATDEEVGRRMPGDEIVVGPTLNATRAVTINAPPHCIWPWLVQMGCKRGGWYSYDWIDNLGRPSADRIMPEYQHLETGQIVPMSPNGKMGMYVKSFAAPDWLVWGDKGGDSTWCWGLYPLNAAQTRLVSRIRLRYRWLSPTILFSLLLDAGDIIMMRKCMLGIKQRAEELSRRDRAGRINNPR